MLVREGTKGSSWRKFDLLGELFDRRLAWTQYRGISREGAVLVRLDRFVGWRSEGAAEYPAKELASALGKILGKKIAALNATGAVGPDA